jgi:hypothetical protein
MLKQAFMPILLTLTLATSLRADWSPHARLSERKNTTIYVASVQFPAAIKELPSIRAYFGGRKISGEPDGDQLLFTIETDRSMRKLYLIVVEDISFAFDETVQYLKLKSDTRYKLWSLELMHKKNSNHPPHKVAGGIKLNGDDSSPYFWIMHEELLDTRTGRVPDNAIVILYDPSFFEGDLIGGSSVYLPKLMISSNILKRVGSEEKLHEISTRFLLSALNPDTLHASPKYAIEQHPTTNRIMVVTT